MTDVQQKVPGTAEKSNGTGREMEVSQPLGHAPLSQGHLSGAKEILASRQADLDQHRAKVVHEIATLNADLEKVPDAEVTKRLSVRKKIKAAEDQLSVIAEEQASLDQEREAITREERRGRVEQAARTRQEAQAEGRALADTIRHTLGLLEEQYGQWKELKEHDRITQDILRSLAPHRMTELPDFSYASGVDQNFQIILGHVIAECRRSLADLQSRGHPLPAEMQERINRQQLGRIL